MAMMTEPIPMAAFEETSRRPESLLGVLEVLPPVVPLATVAWSALDWQAWNLPLMTLLEPEIDLKLLQSEVTLPEEIRLKAPLSSLSAGSLTLWRSQPEVLNIILQYEIENVPVESTGHVDGADSSESGQGELGQLRVVEDVQGSTDSLQLRHGDVGELRVARDFESLLDQSQIGGHDRVDAAQSEIKVASNVGERWN